MKPELRRKTRLFIFLISLLLHLGFLSLITFVTFETVVPTEVLEKIKEQIKKQHKEWVERRAGKSQFGAPVVFQKTQEDISQPTEKDEPTQMTQMQPTEESQAIKQEPTKEEKFTQDAITQEPEQEIQEPEFEKLTEEEHQELKDLPLAEKVAEYKPQPQPKKMTVEQLRQLVCKKRPQQKVQNQPQQPQEKSTFQQPEKQKLTFADLAKGFLDRVKDRGNDLVNIKGRRGIPTDEQLRYERYAQKIEWCWQNSIKIHRKKLPRTNNPKQKMHLNLVLNRDGSIKNIVIAESCGNREMDSFIVFAFHDASSSFPPVPSGLPGDPYVMNLCVILYAGYY